MKNILLIILLCSFVSNLCFAQSTLLHSTPSSLPVANLSESFYEDQLGILTDANWTAVEINGKEEVAHFSVQAGQKILIRFEWKTFGKSQIPSQFSGGGKG